MQILIMKLILQQLKLKEAQNWLWILLRKVMKPDVPQYMTSISPEIIMLMHKALLHRQNTIICSV
jgi:hypothetical protein